MNATQRDALCSYPCDNFVTAFFGAIDLNETSPEAFRKQLFLCMVAQALEKKGDISVRRSKNHYGSITWQLNEIWPTGGPPPPRSCLPSAIPLFCTRFLTICLFPSCWTERIEW